MTKKNADPFSELENDVSAAIRRAGIGAKAVVDSVADLLAGAVRASGEAETVLFDWAPLLADAAARGAAKAGGNTGSVARGFLLGALRGSGLSGEPALQAAAEAAGAFIDSVHGVRGDEGGAAEALVEGALVWAGEAGQDANRTAAAVGQAALDAAYDLDAATGREVRDALKVVIAGVSLNLKEPARAHRR
jgi:hypothetical protein